MANSGSPYIWSKPSLERRCAELGLDTGNARYIRYKNHPAYLTEPLVSDEDKSYDSGSSVFMRYQISGRSGSSDEDNTCCSCSIM